MKRVRVKALPKAKDGHETEAKLFNGNQVNWPTQMNQFSLPATTAGKTLQPVDRKDANLEAEKGETAIINQDGIPTNFNVGGKRHSEGGTPLNLPSNSFIFSDTKDMKIKDKTILAQFGATKSMTPADISKKYDINKFRGTLADPDSTDLQRKTAEMMIANYNMKLAKLGLVQESKKGFPQGIPSISMPYLESTGMDPNSFFQTQAQPEQFNPDMGNAAYGGELPLAQNGLATHDYSKQLSEVEAMKKRVAYDELYKQAYQKELEKFNRQKSEKSKLQSKLSEKEYLDKHYDQKIKERIESMKNFKGDKIKWGYGDVNNKMVDYEKDLLDLMETQKKNREGWYQVKNKLEPVFKTKEEYQASLLQPFTPEKRDAQVEWNKLHPDTSYHEPKKKDPYSTTEANIIEAESAVNPGVNKAAPDTLGSLAGLPIVSYKAGGELDTYQGGGKVVAWVIDKANPENVQPKYEDGSLGASVSTAEAIKLANNKGTSQPATTTDKGTGTKTGTPSEIPIYNQTTEEWIKSQKAAGKNVILPKVIPPGSFRIPVQHGVKDQKNIYGKVRWTPEEQADFKARHPWIYKERPDWNPSNDDDVTWAQTEYSKINPGYFNQKDAKGNPIRGTGIDSDFGAHTFSMPGIMDAEQKAADDAGVITKTPDAEKKAAVAAMATAQQPGHDPWWLQDIVKTAGAAGDFFRVKKYAPWQATPGVTLPDPTFYDPTRELAANAEMANLGVQGLNAFTNPQAYAAAFSQIQGQGAKNAADILGKYNQMNVGVANDFETNNTQIMNQAAANRAGLSTQLADKYTIMNQQFDNSKNMARQNLRQSYIDAVTNKNYTGNVNDLYEQYKIDPSTGGRIRWTHGRPITPEANDQDMISKVNATALALRKQNPGMDVDKAVEHAIKLLSGGSGKQSMYDQSAMGYPG